MPGFSLILKPHSVPPICEIFEPESPSNWQAQPEFSDDNIVKPPTTDSDTIDSTSSHHHHHQRLTTVDLSNYEEDGRSIVASGVDPFHRLPASWMRGIDAVTRVWIRLHRDRHPFVTFETSGTEDEVDGQPPISQTLSDGVTFVARFQMMVHPHIWNEDDDDDDSDTEMPNVPSGDEGDSPSESNSTFSDYEKSDWDAITSCEIDGCQPGDGKDGDGKPTDSSSIDPPQSAVVINWVSFEKLAVKLSVEEQGELFLRVLTHLFESAKSPSEGQEEAPADSDASWSIWDYVPIVGSIRSLGVASRAATEGDTKGFLINSTVGISGLALDLLTVSTGVAAITGAVKMGVHLGARELAKGVVKGMITGAARSAAISGTIGAGVGGLQDGAAGAVQGGLRGVAGGLVSGSLTGGSKGAVLIGQGAATASGMTALAVSAKAARAVKMTAKVAKKMHERKERAYFLLKEVIQDTISIAS